MSMNPHEAAENIQSLLGAYPNTYCVTKSMAEEHLKRYRGNLRVVINRPSIIFSNYSEPLPGWTDTVSAAGTVAFPVALGLAKHFWGIGNLILDVIPCDIVANSIIAQTVQAVVAEPESKLSIFHVTTSTVNPV